MSIFVHTRPLGSTLSLLWLFAILNMLFRDIHEMTMASTINEILSGNLNGNPVTEQVLLAGAFAVELLLLAMLLSALMSEKAAKKLNLVLAPVAIPATLAIWPGDPDDYFFAIVEVCTFVVIFIVAWRWKSEDQTAVVHGGYHAA